MVNELVLEKLRAVLTERGLENPGNCAREINRWFCRGRLRIILKC